MYRTFSTTTQNEAMINELKGRLFEYLVAQELACQFSFEEQFVSSFKGACKEQLQHYEAWLRRNRPSLLPKLLLLAKKTVAAIYQQLPTKAVGLHLISKDAQSLWAAKYHEGDFLLERECGSFIPVSLKLCKAHSFVNTKSGGVKSFLGKYFAPYEGEVEFWQSALNQQVTTGFQSMGAELYGELGLDYVDGFDAAWTEAGQGELPGQLAAPLASIVQKSYRGLIGIIYRGFVDLKEKNPQKFIHCLLPLLGLGNEDLLQLICYHKNSDFVAAYLETYGDVLKKMKNPKIMPLNEEVSSFEVHLLGRILQVRIKPMNKFTIPAFKVNCSVKRVV